MQELVDMLVEGLKLDAPYIFMARCVVFFTCIEIISAFVTIGAQFGKHIGR